MKQLKRNHRFNQRTLNQAFGNFFRYYDTIDVRAYCHTPLLCGNIDIPMHLRKIYKFFTIPFSVHEKEMIKERYLLQLIENLNKYFHLALLVQYNG
jgi:hypothetical protein